MDGLLGLAVCGAPLSSRSADVATALVAAGWSLQVRATHAAVDWIDPEELSAAARAPVQIQRLPPDDPIPPDPQVAVAFPLTFSTANKVVHGINDTTACHTLVDALALDIPVVAVLSTGARLWRHPTWASTLRVLTDAGVLFLDSRTGTIGEPTPGTRDVVDGFDPDWVVKAVARL